MEDHLSEQDEKLRYSPCGLYFRPFRLNAFPGPPVIDSADSQSVPGQFERREFSAGRYNCYK